MTDRILRWGILSTARINRAILPPLRASKRNQLLAVASRSQAAADHYAREHGIPRSYRTYEDLLADPEIDVVYNPLPNHLHAEWTIRAVEAGKHVLCEKPLALRVEDVEAMQAAARQHGRVVTEAFMYRHHPQTLKVQEMVQSGILGDLRLIRGSFRYVLSRPGDVRLDPGMGGGSIWDVGCYPISYARIVAGAPPAEAFGWQITGPSGIDETFVGQIRFANGVHAQFDSSFTTPLHAHMEIVGSLGRLSIPEPFKPGTNEKIYLTREDKTDTIEIPGQELYIGEVEDMADAILLGDAPRISPEDSRANVAVIVALIESAHSGKPVIIA